jgi:hypothetical protein
MNAICPIHLLLLELIMLIPFGEQYKMLKLLTAEFTLFCHHFPLSILLSTIFWNSHGKKPVD